MCEAAGAGGGMAGAEPASVLWPPMLCWSQQCAPHLSDSPLKGRMEAAVEPPHQAPGHSPARLEQRGRQGAWAHAPPPQARGHTL